MQGIKHNGNEYKTMAELQRDLLNGVVSREDFDSLWMKVQALDRDNDVFLYFKFTDEQWNMFNREKKDALWDAMVAKEEIEDVKYQLDEYRYWADNRPDDY